MGGSPIKPPGAFATQRDKIGMNCKRGIKISEKGIGKKKSA